jgi:predicted polyphosphate/ATP-dependent NAD kinase
MFYRKAIVAVTVLGIAMGVSGCSGFRANTEDCDAIRGYISEIVAIQNATIAKISDNAYRRSGIKLWTAKLDELEAGVSPREAQLESALADWIAKSRAVAETFRPNLLDLDTAALDKAAGEFQSSNQTLGSMCSS